MNLPAHLTAQERSAIEQAVNTLTTRFALQIRLVALFGSKARGDFGPESDIDLLVVSESDDWQLRDQLRDPVFDVNVDFGLYISPRIIGWERFRSLDFWRPGLMANLRREAIELWRRPGVDDPFAQPNSTLTPQPV